MLAISLHATSDALRDELVPINRKYPIAELLEACRAYPGLSNARRITFEYVMLKGVNDSLADAKALVRLLAGIPAKINLIPFNPWPGAPYECSDWEQIERFAEVVNRAGYASPVRTPRGRDIMAACGQLKSESVKLRAEDRKAAARGGANEAGTNEPGERLAPDQAGTGGRDAGAASCDGTGSWHWLVLVPLGVLIGRSRGGLRRSVRLGLERLTLEAHEVERHHRCRRCGLGTSFATGSPWDACLSAVTLGASYLVTGGRRGRAPALGDVLCA